MHRLVSPVLSLLCGIAVLGISGCSKGGSVSSSQERSILKQKSVLKVQIHAEPLSLDPAEVEDGVGLQLISQLREGLVGYDAEGRLRNLLAESYVVSKDGRRFEFKLKQDLRWSDGQPLSVQDFVYGIRRALSPEHAGKVSEELMPIRGARDYRAGRLSSSKSLLAKDSKDRSIGVFEENGKLVFELEQAAPYFIHALTLPAALPVRQDMLIESSGKWSEDKAPGTGPYRFAAYQPGKRFLIEANPYYWAGRSSIGLIDFLFVADDSTGLNLFETGQLDILTRVPATDVGRLRKLSAFHTSPFFATYFVSFNTRKAPFDRKEFRRAVSGSIRRAEMTRALDTGEKPALSWIPEGIEGYFALPDSASVFSDSIRKVRQEISQHPVATVSVAFDSSARNSLLMEKVQHDLLQELGMKTSLSNLDWKSYVKSLQTDAPQIYRFGWLTPFMDPINPLQAYVTGNPNNYSGWSNAEYDRLVREISAMPSGKARAEKIRRAQKILVEDEAAVVPIYHYVQNHLVSARVKGFKVNPFGIISFHDLSLDLN